MVKDKKVHVELEKKKIEHSYLLFKRYMRSAVIENQEPFFRGFFSKV